MKQRLRLGSQEVRRIRGRLGLKQRQLADVLGVTQSAVASWEQDRKHCVGTTALILKILNPGTGGVVLKELLRELDSLKAGNDAERAEAEARRRAANV